MSAFIEEICAFQLQTVIKCLAAVVTSRAMHRGLSDGIFPILPLRIVYLSDVPLVYAAWTLRKETNTTHLPSRGWEYVLVPLVIASLDDFARMRLVFLHSRVGEQTNVVVDVEIEQWTGLAAGFVHDEVVERVVLAKQTMLMVCERHEGYEKTYVWNDEILLHVHEVVDTDAS